ncbi:MAG TPA: RES family NAD+ phosphorylase [Alphaproteobacteria bacterium]|jgi:hypothetical protein
MWTPAALRSEVRGYAQSVWRVVETQYKAATMRLTDSLEEQRILEQLLEDSKPPLPPECQGLSFLLATPFRYAPYPFGSRFRRAVQPEGVFYGAEQIETAISEAVFYALLFYLESPDMTLPTGPIAKTAFSVRCASDRSIDLTVPKLDRDKALWTHPTDYSPCQALADAAREIDVQVIRYRSVRDEHGRASVALMSPAAFTDRQVRGLQTWHFLIKSRAVVQAWCESPRMMLEFPAGRFQLDPRIPA